MFEPVREKDAWTSEVVRAFVTQSREAATVTGVSFSPYDWNEYSHHHRRDCGKFVVLPDGGLSTGDFVVAVDPSCPMGTLTAVDGETPVFHRWRDTDAHPGPVNDCMHPDCAVRAIMGDS